MTILIAPDKFKGTLSAPEVTDILASHLAPLGHHIIKLPMADGGEGTAETLSRLLDMSPRTIPAHDSLMRSIPGGAKYYVNSTTRTVALDSSSVLGLSLIDPKASSPLTRTSYPLGLLLLDIIRKESPSSVYIGVGGTSTVDGGKGFLKALGYDYRRFTTASPLPPVIGLSDVAVPLVAPDGKPSSLSFAPQKGATQEEIDTLRTRLSDFQKHFPGITTEFAGAGGGMGFALAAIGAKMTLGADYILRLADIDTMRPGLIITGEGSLDSQTSLGKVVGQLIDYGIRHGIPVAAVGGRIMPDFDPHGTVATFSTQHYPPQGCLNYRTAKARLAATANAIAKWIEERHKAD